MPDPWTLLFVSFLSRFFFPSLSSFPHIPLLVSLCLFFPSPVVFQNFSCFGRTLIESARSGGGRIGAKVSWVEHTSVSLLSGGTLQSQADAPPRERDRCTPAVQPPAGEASRGLPTADVPRELCPLTQCPPTLCPLTLEDTSHTHTPSSSCALHFPDSSCPPVPGSCLLSCLGLLSAPLAGHGLLVEAHL